MPESHSKRSVQGVQSVRPGAILRELKAGQTRELAAPDSNPIEPTLNLERDGNRVVRITARCACGRDIEIQCDYEELMQEQA